MSTSNQEFPRSTTRRSAPRSRGAGSTAPVEHSATSPPSHHSRLPANNVTLDARQHPSAATSQTPTAGRLANGISAGVGRVDTSPSGRGASHQAVDNNQQRSSIPSSSNRPDNEVSSRYGGTTSDEEALAAELRALLALDDLDVPSSQQNRGLGPPPSNRAPPQSEAGSRGQSGLGGRLERSNGATPPHGRGHRIQHSHARGHGIISPFEQSQPGEGTDVGGLAAPAAPREATNAQSSEGWDIPTAGEMLASQLEAFQEIAATLRSVLHHLGSEEMYEQQDLEQLQYFDDKIAELEWRLGLPSELSRS